MKNKFVFLLILFFAIQNLFAQTDISSYHLFNKENDKNIEKIELISPISYKNYLVSYSEAIAQNVLLFCYNHYIDKAIYSNISFETIKENFKHGLVWDQDFFVYNGLGHPYQGAYYFSGARSCGLNFYESTLVDLFGSVTWEFFAENEYPAWNDVIITTFGAASVGEMLHRLYLSSKKSGLWPLSILISPMDAVNSLIYPISNIPEIPIEFSYYTAIGYKYFRTDFEKESLRPSKELRRVTGNIGFSVDYGSYFFGNSTEPYSGFILDAEAFGGKEYYHVGIFSQGLLGRFKLWSKDNSLGMLGFSNDLDTFQNNESECYNMGYGIVTRQLVELPGNSKLDFMGSIDISVFGILDYYYLLQGEKDLPTDGAEYRLSDFTMGPFTKLRLCYSHPLLGTLGINNSMVTMHTINQTVPFNGSDGVSFLSMTKIFYEHVILNRNLFEKHPVSIGITADWFYKKAFYKVDPDLSQNGLTFSLYLKQKL